MYIIIIITDLYYFINYNLLLYILLIFIIIIYFIILFIINIIFNKSVIKRRVPKLYALMAEPQVLQVYYYIYLFILI